MLEDGLFSKAGSHAISDQYTAVRLLGGDDATDEGRAFAVRYRVEGFPTLLAMSADGAVLSRKFQRDLPGILSTLQAAAKAQATFLATEKALGDSEAPADLRTMAGLYKSRMQLAQARARYEALPRKDRRVEDQIALLEVLTDLDDADARKALLGTLLETYPDHAAHLEWRIQLATADLPAEATSPDEFRMLQLGTQAALEPLLAELTKPAEQALVRSRLAEVLSNLRDLPGALAHLDWILANVKGTPIAVDALMRKGLMHINLGYGSGNLAKVKEGRALLQQLIDEHPRHPQASRAQRMLPQVDRIVRQLEAKRDAEKSGDADDGK